MLDNRRRSQLILGFGLSLILFATAFSLTSCHRTPTIHDDVATLDRDIRKNLPIGSSREQVKAYLDQRKIPHSSTGEMPDSTEFRNSEVALIRGDSGFNVVRTDVQIVFHFDPSGSKLSGYMLKAVYTGP